MPILDIEIVSDAELAGGLARRVADAAAPVFGAAPGSVWVKVRRIPTCCYAENGQAPGEAVFVTVIRRTAPEDAADEHARLAVTLGCAIGVAVGQVHITYEPPAAGRQSFGGRLVD